MRRGLKSFSHSGLSACLPCAFPYGQVEYPKPGTVLPRSRHWPDAVTFSVNGPHLAGAGAVALAILAGPQASASTGETVEVYTGWDTALSGVTHQYYATDCGDVFKGPVTSDDGNGDVVASIGNFSMNCNQGVSVTPNAMPWTFNLHGGVFTIEGIDVNITTSQGTCRYTGSVQGSPEDQGYYMTGTLSRQSTGCGGDAQVQITDPFEVFGITG